jgi:hypothetical protein
MPLTVLGISGNACSDTVNYFPETASDGGGRMGRIVKKPLDTPC